MNRNLFFRTWDESADIISRSEAVLLLLGSVEEHGYHLPLGTDVLLAEDFAEAVCEAEDLYYYPCIPYGQTWSARGFGGTIGISRSGLAAYCGEAVENLISTGAKKVILFSFHKGNFEVMNDVVRAFKERGTEIYKIQIRKGEGEAKKILKTPVWEDKIWHAGELETSLMLYLHGELVRMDRATSEFPEKPERYDVAAVPWKEFLVSGAFGDARAADSETGKRIFELFCRDLLEQVKTIKGI